VITSVAVVMIKVIDVPVATVEAVHVILVVVAVKIVIEEIAATVKNDMEIAKSAVNVMSAMIVKNVVNVTTAVITINVINTMTIAMNVLLHLLQSVLSALNNVLIVQNVAMNVKNAVSTKIAVDAVVAITETTLVILAALLSPLNTKHTAMSNR
jgi:hypothetical protein